MPKKTINERARFMAGQRVRAELSLDAIAWLAERDSDMSDVQLTTGELNEHSRAVVYIDLKEPYL